ncbi:hypothetical protein J6590_053105 [Homalodisca vitripennis]|nr:hypothetical protein J6590_053105 [Homalodisca vitripennis]
MEPTALARILSITNTSRRVYKTIHRFAFANCGENISPNIWWEGETDQMQLFAIVASLNGTEALEEIFTQRPLEMLKKKVL